MSCYHPLVGVWKGEHYESGAKKFEIHGNLDPFQAMLMWPGSVSIPCGKCIGCKLDYSRQWADRMMLELETADKAIFLTLTYNNENVPFAYDEFGNFTGLTLCKRDLQLFMKRLRKHFGSGIRFFACGEYGTKTLRPHYHAIIYGIGVDDFPSKRNLGTNELHQKYYTSKLLEDIWSNGFVLFSDVSWKTCAYVARYVTKKVGKELSDINGACPEFSQMSRRPGIGSEYLRLHPDCFDNSVIPLSSSTEGYRISIPKYYLRKLKLTDSERYAKIMDDRKWFAIDKALLELSNTDLSYLDYLEVKENEKLNEFKGLRRTKV